MVTRRSQRIGYAILGVGAFLILLMSIDAATEDEPVPVLELLMDAIELALIVVSATGVALLTGSFERERQEKKSLIHDLRVARIEGESWRQRAQTFVNGLGEAIEAQFEDWKLTQSKREVGLLMLKGFSHSEIASLRGTTEATVRHQARAVYQKSGMPGRSAFCAYFLEDLLPTGGRAAAPVAGSAAGGATAAQHSLHQPERAD